MALLTRDHKSWPSLRQWSYTGNFFREQSLIGIIFFPKKSYVTNNETIAKVEFKISPVILLDEPQYWVRASSLFCPADFYPVLSFEDQQIRQPLFDEQDQVFWWMI